MNTIPSSGGVEFKFGAGTSTTTGSVFSFGNSSVATKSKAGQFLWFQNLFISNIRSHSCQCFISDGTRTVPSFGLKSETRSGNF